MSGYGVAQESRAPWQVPEAAAGVRRMRELIMRRNYFGAEFAADFYIENISIPMTPAGGAFIYTFEVEKDAQFEWMATNTLFLQNGATNYTQAMGGFLMQVADGGTGRNMFSQPIPIGAVAGYGQFPHIMPIPHIFPPGSDVQVFFSLPAAYVSSYSAQVQLIGRKRFLDKERNAKDLMQRDKYRYWQGSDGKLYAEDYYTYAVPVTAAGVGGIGNFTTFVERDADFEWLMASYDGYDETLNQQIQGNQLITSLVTDTGIKRPMANVQQPTASIFGLGQVPLILPKPHIFKAMSGIRVDMTNNDAADTFLIYHCFEGRKIFEIQ